jgi:hypothetical protein
MHSQIGDLRNELIEKTLERAWGFGGITPDQKALMLVTVKCTIDLLDGLRRTAEEVRSFNDCTSALTKQIIRLNRWLTAATIVGAIATVLIAAPTALAIWRALCALSQRILSG